MLAISEKVLINPTNPILITKYAIILSYIKNIFREVQLKHESDDSFGPQAKSVFMEYLDINKLPSHRLYLQTQTKKTSFYSLWEIQSRNPFQGGFATYQASFRLKIALKIV